MYGLENPYKPAVFFISPYGSCTAEKQFLNCCDNSGVAKLFLRVAVATPVDPTLITGLQLNDLMGRV